MTEDIKLDIKDRIAHIQINRPKAMNAVNPPMMKEMADLFRQLDEDDENVSVIVLSGAGDNFSAGYDLKFEWSSHYGPGVFDKRRMLRDCVDFEFCPWECSKPVIAMVRGYCLAGSCELAMLACITFASETAKFGEPEIRFSTAPPALIMPWIVGLKKSRELLYSGDVIDAQEALAMGLVNRVIADDDLENETFRYARKIAAVALEGLRSTKASINKGAEIAGIKQAIDYGIEQGAMLDATETEVYRRFSEIRKAEGLSAAIRWREGQFSD